jgi:hypothetical protein
MTVKLSRTAFSHAESFIDRGQVVLDQRDDWSEHQPSTAEENKFIKQHGYAEYGKWHLGVDDAHRADTKVHYKFPYGDFVKVHRCAVLTIESRAGQYKHTDIELAAAHLHGMMDALVKARAKARA